ncbi:MAG TPA: hypothetical protein ENL01_01720, partial [Chlorobaculum parvum]|nr:hypothetical protein [Chlorobaculum parvum]
MARTIRGNAATRSRPRGDRTLRSHGIGSYALSAGFYDAFYLKAQKVRTLVIEDFNKVFENVDIILA